MSGTTRGVSHCGVTETSLAMARRALHVIDPISSFAGGYVHPRRITPWNSLSPRVADPLTREHDFADGRSRWKSRTFAHVCESRRRPLRLKVRVRWSAKPSPRS